MHGAAVVGAVVLLLTGIASAGATRLDNTGRFEIVGVHADGTHRAVVDGPSALTLDEASFSYLIRSRGGRWFAYPTSGSPTGWYAGTVDTVRNTVPVVTPLPVFGFAAALDGPFAAFSPNARRVAFMEATCVAPACTPTCDPRCSQIQIDVAGTDGSGLHMVAQQGMYPVWSADGRLLAFRGHVDEADDGYDTGVFVVRPDGTGLRRLGAGDEPAFAPTGDRVAFACGTGMALGICVAPATGGAGKRLLASTATTWFTEPAWSPDGTQLAAFACRARGCRLVVVPAAGGAPRTIARARAGIAPLWSPDGERLAYLDPVAGLDVSPTDGGHRVRVIHGAFAIASVRWAAARRLTYATFLAGG